MTTPAAGAATEVSLALDTHVHFYPQFDVATALDAAWSNLQRVIDAHHLENGLPALLWTRFAREIDVRQRLLDADSACGGWHAEMGSDDAPGFLVRHPSGRRIFIFTGMQLISAEGLEVLIAGCHETSAERLPVEDIIQHYSRRHLVILPWGVGKWFGRRGRLVEKLLEGPLQGRFVLGDNSARPAFWAPIRAFVRAERNHHTRVCPGTDPLPIAGQEKRIGCSGIVLDHLGPDIFTSSDILRLAVQPGASQFKTVFDRREHPLRFFFNQLKIRLP